MFASTSSGPIMMVLIDSNCAVCLERPEVVGVDSLGAVAAIVGLDLVMNDPVNTS